MKRDTHTTGESPRASSAIAELLRLDEHGTTIKDHHCQERAAKLDAWVSHWRSQRLWSINLVPELVAHDENHAANVELLLASLIAPVWTNANRECPKLELEELEWLTVAAWLHDWGHVGGPISFRRNSGEDYTPSYYVSEPCSVRKLHGAITRELLSSDWRGMHGIPTEIAEPAGILCAHHQGWTSFGSRSPKSYDLRDPYDLKLPDSEWNTEHALPLVEFPSLEHDCTELQRMLQKNRPEALPPSFGLNRMQLLVALLRVADAADLGGHRVIDRGSAKDTFLARCLYRKSLETMRGLIAMQTIARRELAAMQSVYSHVKQHLGAADSSEARKALKGMDDELERIRKDEERRNYELRKLRNATSEADAYRNYALQKAWKAQKSERGKSTTQPDLVAESMIRPVQELIEYNSFLENQWQYIERHSRVDSVRFEYDPKSKSYDVVVSASDSSKHPEHEKAAVATVIVDIRRELEKAKGAVRRVLADGGFRFRCGRTVDGHHAIRFDDRTLNSTLSAGTLPES